MTTKQNKLVDQVDQWFQSLARWAVNHRLLVVLMALALLICGGYFASKVQSDNSLDAYFNKNDPTYIAYAEYLDEFLSDEVTYILYRVPDRPHGPFNHQAMQQIGSLTQALENEVPFARKVTSLTNVEFIRAEGDSINIDELMLDFPETQQELLEIRELVLDRPLFVDYLINANADYAAIIIDMELSSVDNLETITYDKELGNDINNLYPQVSYVKIQEILQRPEYAGIEFFLTGDVPMNSVYNYIFLADSATGTLLTLAILALLSLLLFRSNLAALFGPLTVVILSLVLVLGIMGAFGWVLGLFFGIIPTLLCAVGVAQSVHILLEFQRAYHQTGDRKAAVQIAIGKVGGACLLAALTTALGFLVLSVSELKVLGEMAYYAAAGVLFTFILSTTLLVAVLAGGKKTDGDHQLTNKPTSSIVRPSIIWLVERCITLNLNHPKKLLTAGTAVLLLSLVGISQLKVDFNFLTEFQPHVEWRQHTELAESVMGGILNVTYIVDADEPEGLKSPELLAAIDQFQRFAEQQPLVKKAYSIVDFQKDLNRSFHGDDPSWYRVPEDRDLVAQYFLIYEVSGGEELENFVTRDYSSSVVELRVEMTGSANIIALINTLDGYLADHPLPSASVRKSGIGLMWVKIAEYISDTQIQSYSLLFVMITVVLCIAFGSVKVGLLSMIPNMAPVIVVLGLMGWSDMHLDYMKLLLATIAISIAVDDTIHLIIRFRKCFLATGSYHSALRQSMRDVGPALIITTIILVGAFSCYLLSDMAVIASFGVLLSIAILVALLADLVFMPALLLVTKPFGPEFVPSEIVPTEPTATSEINTNPVP